MALNITERKLLPVRRDGQTPTTVVVGSFSIGCAGTYSGGTGGATYYAGTGICIDGGNNICVDFGTSSTKAACGSHNHTGTYLPIAGCACDSAKLNNQSPSDITSNLTAGQVLYYDGTTIRSCAGGGGATCLDALNDVVIASPDCNQILQYSGSIWCNCTPTNISANMSTGQVLCYNGSTLTGVTTVSCASNALALCGCVPSCFLGATATANNSNCLGGLCSSCYAPKISTISPKTANYTLQATDNGTIIIMSGASALCLTVPTAFGTCGYNVTVIRRGAGAVCILAGASTTKLSDGSKSCIGVQYGAATVIMLESCRFILAGNLV